MPKRNIGWRWHLASFPEITAWQLEVNKSWSCEKLFPSLLPSLLLSSLQRQTPQHVFHILASQFIELLSGRWLRCRLAPGTRESGTGELSRGRLGWDGGWRLQEPPAVPGAAGLCPHRAPALANAALCHSSAAGAVTRKVVATETKPPQTPLSLTGKDGAGSTFAVPGVGLPGPAAAASSACASHHLLSSRVIVHRWVDLETWWLALWGFGNCSRVVRGSSFICHCSHCEEHFMPREFLAFNRGMCHKVLFLLIC